MYTVLNREVKTYDDALKLARQKALELNERVALMCVPKEPYTPAYVLHWVYPDQTVET